jgi:hypothetical protein
MEWATEVRERHDFAWWESSPRRQRATDAPADPADETGDDPRAEFLGRRPGLVAHREALFGWRRADDATLGRWLALALGREAPITAADDLGAVLDAFSRAQVLSVAPWLQRVFGHDRFFAHLLQRLSPEEWLDAGVALESGWRRFCDPFRFDDPAAARTHVEAWCRRGPFFVAHPWAPAPVRAPGVARELTDCSPEQVDFVTERITSFRRGAIDGPRCRAEIARWLRVGPTDPAIDRRWLTAFLDPDATTPRASFELASVVPTLEGAWASFLGPILQRIFGDDAFVEAACDRFYAGHWLSQIAPLHFSDPARSEPILEKWWQKNGRGRPSVLTVVPIDALVAETFASQRSSIGAGSTITHPALVYLRDDPADVRATLEKLADEDTPATPAEIPWFVERLGFDVEALFRLVVRRKRRHDDPALLAAALRVRSPKMVRALEPLATRPTLRPLVETYLAEEGANVIEGLLELAGTRGKSMTFALDWLSRLARDERGRLTIATLAARHDATVRARVAPMVPELAATLAAAAPEGPAADAPTSAKKKRTAKTDAKRTRAAKPGHEATEDAKDTSNDAATHAAELPTWITALPEAAPDAPLPPWLIPEDWPPILAAGIPLSVAQVRSLLVALLDSEPLRAEACRTLDADRFAESLAAAWSFRDGFDAWVAVWASLAREHAVHELVRRIRKDRWPSNVWAGWPERRRAIRAVAEVDHWAGRQAALALPSLLPSEELSQEAENALVALEGHLGVARHELEDRAVPVLAVEPDGVARFDFGARTIRFELVGAHDPSFVDEKSARFPNASAKDDPTKVAQARAAYELVARELPRSLDAIAERWTRDLVRGAWRSIGHLRAVVLENALLASFARRVIWRGRTEAGEIDFLLPSASDAHDVAMQTVSLDTISALRLTHPAELDDATRAAWAQVLSDYEIIAPIPQLAWPRAAPLGVGDPLDLPKLRAARARGWEWNLVTTFAGGKPRSRWLRGLGLTRDGEEVAVELDRKIELDLKDQPKRVSYGPPLIARLTRRVADGTWTAFEPAGVFRAELAWLAEAQVD